MTAIKILILKSKSYSNTYPFGNGSTNEKLTMARHVLTHSVDERLINLVRHVIEDYCMRIKVDNVMNNNKSPIPPSRL